MRDGLAVLLVDEVPGRHGGDRRRPVTGGADRSSRRARRAAARKGKDQTTTETVYRNQIRPVVPHGAEAMDRIFPEE